MRAVLLKAWRETRVPVLLYATGMFLIALFIAAILPQLQGQADAMFASMPFVRTMMSALLGTDIGEGFTAPILQSIAWVHPVVLTLAWAFVIVGGTRYPAGEIDRGTIDVLLGLPLSRRRVLCAETLAWAIGAAVLVACAYAGFMLGCLGLEPAWRPDAVRLLVVAGNLLALLLAVGALAQLASSVCDRRGRAIGMAGTVVLASFLLNFLAQVWAPAKSIAFLGVLSYHRPAEVLRTGTVPLSDIGVLLGVGIVAWIIAAEIIARRDIATL